MTHLEELTSTLNDLVLINNDRIEGYQNAINSLETKDADLKMLFAKMISNSRDHVSVLGDLILEAGGEIEEGTTASGKIFRSWMSIKSLFSGSDRTSILESCEGGEDAALKAYDMALSSDVEMNVGVRQVLMDQRVSLSGDHNQVKKMRDLNKTLA
ncbi:ferritin-like domain-containing protein [Aquiflexum gelatinilyticum]|uniref:ferritin-like domain-containing protein n=1 Tax=Aquiflexum gelatinilyticum TaxID=2961943 RepID=UPI0021688778|nr:PA2169 family four-helix-bundle protein [Aquiflexum gelatinilyticum]MCS4433463.1 PA2169 family four-helix-bundle protein [Aquiflexum gelatinilyticum]